jgi:hypothetical protein
MSISILLSLFDQHFIRCSPLMVPRSCRWHRRSILDGAFLVESEGRSNQENFRDSAAGGANLQSIAKVSADVTNCIVVDGGVSKLCFRQMSPATLKNRRIYHPKKHEFRSDHTASKVEQRNHHMRT